MTALVWDQNPYEEGLDRGVLYLTEGAFAWNGLVRATESPEGELDTDHYYDGVRYVILADREEYKATVEAWSYPSQFESYEGIIEPKTKQGRKSFGMSYRVLTEDSYELHLVYNATALPLDEVHSSRNNEFELSLLSWTVVTKQDSSTFGVAPVAHLVVDVGNASPAAIAALEDLLYGTSTTSPELPEPWEVRDLFLAHALFVVTDHGDGTATITGPDDAVYMLDATSARITWPSVIQTSSDTYSVSTF